MADVRTRSLQCCSLSYFPFYLVDFRGLTGKLYLENRFDPSNKNGIIYKAFYCLARGHKYEHLIKMRLTNEKLKKQRKKKSEHFNQHKHTPSENENWIYRYWRNALSLSLSLSLSLFVSHSLFLSPPTYLSIYLSFNIIIRFMHLFVSWTAMPPIHRYIYIYIYISK